MIKTEQKYDLYIWGKDKTKNTFEILLFCQQGNTSEFNKSLFNKLTIIFLFPSPNECRGSLF